MSRMIFTGLILLFSATLTAALSAEDDRVKSRVLEYFYAPAMESQHKVVQTIIRNNILYIRDSLATTSHDLDYLNDVGTYPEGGAPLLSPGELKAIWDNPEAPALLVLFGNIAPEVSTSLTINSEIYIGELPTLSKAPLSKNSFRVVSNTGISQYGRLADAHGYILVYALILDAMRTKKPKNVVLSLIDASATIFGRLSENALVTPELESIHDSIGKICGGPQCFD